MDIFIEQLIKKESDTKLLLQRIGIVVLVIILSLAAIFFGGLIAPLQSLIPLLVIAIIYGGWHLFGMTQLEYEYVITNGEIDIDKIIAQKKRTRICSFDGKNVEDVGKYKSDDHKNKSYGKIIKACINENDEKNTWYVVYKDPNFGNTLVLFSPNEKVLDAFKKSLPRQMQVDVQLWN